MIIHYYFSAIGDQRVESFYVTRAFFLETQLFASMLRKENPDSREFNCIMSYKKQIKTIKNMVKYPRSKLIETRILINIFIIFISILIIGTLTLCKHPARHWATVNGEAFIKSSSAVTESCTITTAAAAAAVPRYNCSSNMGSSAMTTARVGSNPRETVIVWPVCAEADRVSNARTENNFFFLTIVLRKKRTKPEIGGPITPFVVRTPWIRHETGWEERRLARRTSRRRNGRTKQERVHERRVYSKPVGWRLSMTSSAGRDWPLVAGPTPPAGRRWQPLERSTGWCADVPPNETVWKTLAEHIWNDSPRPHG